MATGGVNDAGLTLRWELLLAKPPNGDNLTVRLAVPAQRNDIFIALDASERRHLLVQIPTGEPTEISERISRGISVQTVRMKVDSNEDQRNFVDVVCLDPLGHAALDVIVAEMVDSLLSNVGVGRVILVQNVLGKWRRFWSGVVPANLSYDEQLGLFGELWFLARWLGPSIGLSSAVQLWRGPLRARNDFEGKKVGIEVKASARSDGAHRVNGLEQLLEPEEGSLFLFSLTVRPEASASNALPTLVHEIRRALETDSVALHRFEATLSASRYDDSATGEYAKLQLRVRTEEIYRVSDGFPRLIQASLKLPLPLGIDAVTYDLRLDGAHEWRLATSAKSAEVLLRDFLYDPDLGRYLGR